MLTPEFLIQAAKKTVPPFKWVIGSAALLALATGVIKWGVNLGPVLMVAGVLLVGAVALLVLHRMSKLRVAETSSMALFMGWSLILVLVTAIFLILTATALNWPWPIRSWIEHQLGSANSSPARSTNPEAKKTPDQPPRAPKLPKNLAEYYRDDFPKCFGQSEMTIGLGRISTTTNFVNVKLLLDLDSESRFIAAYFPSSASAAEAIKIFAQSRSEIISNLATGILITSQNPGNSAPFSSANLTTTAISYIYHESDLSLESLGELEKVFRMNGLKVQFRGPQYVTTKYIQELAQPSGKP